MTTALLIIDVQTDLCTGPEAAHDCDGVIARINGAAARARAAGAPVFLVQHEEDDGGLVRGGAGWQLDARLQIAPADRRVFKRASDAYHGTDLEAQLRALGVGRVAVCGLQSDFCVDSTVRRSLALGFPVWLLHDAHTTVAMGALSAPQISAHHNTVLPRLGSYGPRATLVAAAAVDFGVS